jgi:hypothetical protein
MFYTHTYCCTVASLFSLLWGYTPCRIYRTGLSRSNILDLYSGGAWFESWPGHRLSRLRGFMIFLSPPGRCGASTSLRPGPPLSKLFSFNHLSNTFHPTLCSLSVESEHIEFTYPVTSISLRMLFPVPCHSMSGIFNSSLNSTMLVSSVLLYLAILLRNPFPLAWSRLFLLSHVIQGSLPDNKLGSDMPL